MEVIVQAWQKPTVGRTDSSDTKLLSMDDIVENLFLHRTWRYSIHLASLTFFWIAWPSQYYITAFAGRDPTPADSWTCLSRKCEDLVKENITLSKMFPCQITEEKNGTQILLLHSEDIKWELDRTSFAIEFDMYCSIGNGRTEKTFISSIFFLGALTGMIFGGGLLDHVGRKGTSILGYIVLVTSLLCGTFCHNRIFLSTIRYFQGIGSILFKNGMTILCLELMPREFRHHVTGAMVIFWAFGYSLATGLHYIIPAWNFQFLGAAAVVATISFSVFTCIESPRYHLINNDLESATKSLKALASLTESDLKPDELMMENLLNASARHRKQTLKQQLKELWSYPELLIEILIQGFIWFCTAMFLMGLNFGWDTLVPNIYLGYLMSGLGELLSMILVKMIQVFGRRRAHILGYLGVMFSFLLALPQVELGRKWTLESVFCLVGVMFISGCSSGMYLWTGELAPTSHRGLVFSVCSIASTAGSFVGPYIFNNLVLMAPRGVLFGGLATLAALCAVGSFLLVETGDKNIYLTGQDVVERRKKHFRYCI